MNVKKEIVALIGIVFLLLGALFGVNIMSFIFGNLSPEDAGLSLGDAAYNVSAQIQNQSLQAGLTYATNASNQMNIVNVTIILALLIFLFFLFWKVIQNVQKTDKKGFS
ncbi:hypothetical protein LCGC14_1013570 [marine sediment metagenome]|uniref:Uncharacterized protein n=1 Tax=marine sediment metagenome TaxID=412755 RepID=A0A0F9QHU7_9ZZZZ